MLDRRFAAVLYACCVNKPAKLYAENQIRANDVLNQSLHWLAVPSSLEPSNFDIPFWGIEKPESRLRIESHFAEFGSTVDLIKIDANKCKVFGQNLSGLDHAIK